MCNVWEAYMGSAIPMTTTAVPFYYTMWTLPSCAAGARSFWAAANREVARCPSGPIASLKCKRCRFEGDGK